MGSVLEITLGIMTAMGGFVDVSELVFAAQAGSFFLFALIWVFALGTIGINGCLVKWEVVWLRSPSCWI